MWFRIEDRLSTSEPSLTSIWPNTQNILQGLFVLMKNWMPPHPPPPHTHIHHVIRRHSHTTMYEGNHSIILCSDSSPSFSYLCKRPIYWDLKTLFLVMLTNQNKLHYCISKKGPTIDFQVFVIKIAQTLSCDVQVCNPICKREGRMLIKRYSMSDCPQHKS